MVCCRDPGWSRAAAPRHAGERGYTTASAVLNQPQEIDTPLQHVRERNGDAGGEPDTLVLPVVPIDREVRGLIAVVEVVRRRLTLLDTEDVQLIYPRVPSRCAEHR